MGKRNWLSVTDFERIFSRTLVDRVSISCVSYIIRSVHVNVERWTINNDFVRTLEAFFIV